MPNGTIDTERGNPANTEYELATIAALRLHLQGLSYAEIAEKQDCSKSSAFRRVEHALDKMRPHADYDEYRARQLAEMAPARALAYRTINDTETPLPMRFLAIDKLAKVHDRESKLLNLDAAPTPLEEAARELANATPAEIDAELARRATEGQT